MLRLLLALLSPLIDGVVGGYVADLIAKAQQFSPEEDEDGYEDKEAAIWHFYHDHDEDRRQG